MVQEIRLEDYIAAAPEKHYLVLGTKESYGIEELQIIPGPMWDGLTITATFVTSEKSIRVLVPEDGRIDVPQEATAQALSLDNPGTIVFTGTSSGVQRITCDLTYFVEDHAPTEGSDPEPTPSIWEQFVTQVQQYSQQASQSATEAAGSATQAATSETNAAASAAAAAGSAADAAAELANVQGAGNAALTAIGNAQTTAVGEVQTAQTTATQAVEQAGQTAVQQVQQAGTAQVNAVNTAGDAKLAEINAANALLPTPTEADTGKTPIAQPDGTYALEAVTVDAYTKAEADARYAPIESAIKVSGKGTGLVSLSPTVGWSMQGMKLYGRSWQDGTPSVEQEMLIQDAGQGGQVDVTVCGVNLLNIPSLSLGGTVNGVACTVNPNQTINLEGTATNNYLLTVATSIPLENGRQYKCFYASVLLKNDYIVRAYATKTDADNGQNHVDQKYLNDLSALAIPDDDRYYRVTSIRLSGRSTELNDQDASAENVCLGFYVYTGSDEPYEPYTAQQLPVPTPGGLPGIPVSSGGTWTDENGQAWVSDAVDFEAQERTNYIVETNTASSNVFTWAPSYYSAGESTVRFGYITGIAIAGALSNKLPVNTQIWNLDEVGFYTTEQGAIVCRIPKFLAGDTAESAQRYLAQNPIEFLIASADVVSTTPLDSATSAAYKALTTYPGTTNILAPDCGIKASAVGDGTQIIADINAKITALQSAAATT